LLKDQGALRYPTNERCDLIPDRYYLDGTIGFVNPETGATTLNPGEECCTLAGGTFQDNLCFWRRPRDGGQVPQLTNDTRERAAYDNQVNQENLRFAPTGVNSGTRRTSFFATVEEGATAVASEDGTGVGLLQIPVNTVVSGTINVNTVQTTYDGTNGSLGSASYLQYSFKAQNIEGTITADITEHTSARIKDTDATGGRGVAISVSRKSSDLAQLHTDLTLTCTGETYARVNFALDLILNYVDITNAVVDQDTLLHEDGLNIATENNTKLKE
jgi:Flp pilus assembly protein TadG